MTFPCPLTLVARILIHRPLPIYQVITGVRNIARRYVLSAWFYIDVISTLPISAIVNALVNGGNNAASAAQLIRSVRLVRLAKVLRVLKLQKGSGRHAWPQAHCHGPGSLELGHCSRGSIQRPQHRRQPWAPQRRC